MRDGDDDRWRPLGACRIVDPEIFFPVGDPEAPRNWQNTQDALLTCGECEVRQACLDYALSIKEDEGIWGGTTPKDRRAILRARSKDAGVDTSRKGHLPAGPSVEIVQAASEAGFTISQIARQAKIGVAVVESLLSEGQSYVYPQTAEKLGVWWRSQQKNFEGCSR